MVCEPVYYCGFWEIFEPSKERMRIQGFITNNTGPDVILIKTGTFSHKFADAVETIRYTSGIFRVISFSTTENTISSYLDKSEFIPLGKSY
jgi:hypothetical protein